MATADGAAGSRITRVKVTISAITNHLNYCQFIIYIYIYIYIYTRNYRMWPLAAGYISWRFKFPRAEKIKTAFWHLKLCRLLENTLRSERS